MAYPQSNRRRAAQRVAALLIASGVIGGGTAAVAAGEGRRPIVDPGLDCTLHTVVSGDTLSRIAQRNGLTLEDVIARNRHLTNPNLIWPGDQAVIRCAPKADTRPAPSSTVTEPPATTFPQPEAAMQRIEKPAGIDVDKIIADGRTSVTFKDDCGHDEGTPGTHYDDAAVLGLLYKAGARGNQLIGLAAVTYGEANGVPEKVGDCGPKWEKGGWTRSVGIWQIRTLAKEKGTGTARDIDALVGDPEHQAWAAIQVYNGKLAAGQPALSAWTSHLLGNDAPHVERIAGIAQRLGMLDGER